METIKRLVAAGRWSVREWLSLAFGQTLTTGKMAANCYEIVGSECDSHVRSLSNGIPGICCMNLLHGRTLIVSPLFYLAPEVVFWLLR
jgi:hypothetical protein